MRRNQSYSLNRNCKTYGTLHAESACGSIDKTFAYSWSNLMNDWFVVSIWLWLRQWFRYEFQQVSKFPYNEILDYKTVLHGDSPAEHKAIWRVLHPQNKNNGVRIAHVVVTNELAMRRDAQTCRAHKELGKHQQFTAALSRWTIKHNFQLSASVLTAHGCKLLKLFLNIISSLKTDLK